MTEKSRYLGMGLSWNPVSDKSCWTSGSVSRNRCHRCHQRLGDIHLLQGGAGYLRNRDTSSAFFSGKYRQGGRGNYHDHEREQVKTKLLHLTKATTPTTTHNTHALAHHTIIYSFHITTTGSLIHESRSVTLYSFAHIFIISFGSAAHRALLRTRCICLSFVLCAISFM